MAIIDSQIPSEGICMYRRFTLPLLVWLPLVLVSCAQKQPFTSAQLSQESALVYLYRPSIHGHNTPTYRLYVDNEKIPYILGGAEYAPVYLKAGKATFRAVANGILEQSVTLDLHNNTAYFIRTLPQEDGTFTMQPIAADQALNEISRTFLSGSELQIDADKKKLITHNAAQESPSASDEIAKLYKMKEQGIITEEEFIRLKTKVIER